MGDAEATNGASGLKRLPQLSRREVLSRGAAAAGWGAFGVVLLTGAVETIRFFFPRVIFRPPSRFKIGLLEEFLNAKNISRYEWDERMKQRAYLRKIAEAEVAEMEVTEKMLKDEYEREFGERAQVRHIQVSSLARAEEVRRRLKTGEDFELVARQLSENEITAANGGLMPPITRNDPLATLLFREMTFELKVGEVSNAFQEGNWYHIIRLERRFPASNVIFENASHDKLEQKLRDRLVRQRQEALESELFESARVDIQEEELRRQFRKRYPR